MEAVNERWSAELEATRADAAEESRRLRARFEQQLEAYKASASSASGECASFEEELTREREGHLATLAELKEARAKLHAAEREAAERVGELLSEVDEKANQIEEMTQALGAARSTADRGATTAADLQARSKS